MKKKMKWLKKAKIEARKEAAKKGAKPIILRRIERIALKKYKSLNWIQRTKINFIMRRNEKTAKNNNT